MILFLFVLAIQTTISAQNLKVTVKDGNSQGLPYAHIKINNRPVVATDSSGVAYINVNNIHLGDKISAIFLGMVTSQIIYDRVLQTRRECEFILREDAFILKNVDVVGYSNESSRKLFRKVTKFVDPVNYDCVMYAGFNYQYFNAKKSEKYNIEGTFKAKNIHFNNISGNYHEAFYSGRPNEYITSSDTIGLINRLDYHLVIILSMINRTIYMITTNERRDLRYAYLGERDSMHIFRISYPKIKSYPLSFQIILYVDVYTKQMCHAELTAMSCTPYTGENHIDQINIETDLEEYSNITPRKSPVITTKNLRFTVNYAIGSIAKVSMSNELIQYKKYVAPRVKKKKSLTNNTYK